jgi:hypothetical protein
MPSPAAGELPIWVVYDHPSDYPEQYVARQHIVSGDGDRPTGSFVATKVLDDIRELMIKLGLVCITRSDEDDPVILETWL